ncbi:LamG domain-containing protein [Clostridium botulinum]|uniref:LamG domain-containing protein n=1 Tax=Clostridium botulinum TaxID=1491 RepID=UPI0009AF7DAC|nr:LamG domain-containing protein [Clostridium botulinum]MBN3416851.1 hypothetical protein [Clostridium botulinum]MBN3443342.1 hypothetical protein [Clostridium botulinum]MBY6806930.1 LamG domain-containing protein [Clostridium botulinum]NFS08063.1 LamG domain-containing protein [Clostridium botulinum]
MSRYVLKKDYSNNLVANYKFEETSGTICIDSTGKYSGTYNGTTSVEGVDGNARSFNGNSCIKFNESVIPLGKKSIKFKIRVSQVPLSGYNYALFSQNIWDKGYSGLQIYINSEGKLFFLRRSSASQLYLFSISSTFSICDGNWHDILFTWNGTTNSNSVKLYIDNLVLVDEEVTSNNLETESANLNLLVGGNYSGNQYFKGELDEIEIYNEVIEFTNNKYLIQQNNDYYSTKSNFFNIGQTKDSTQLENWYNKYGADDVNIITQNLNNKEFPMSKDENGIWKTDSELDMNEVIDNIELVDTDENNKSIKYNCNDYRILDLCDDQFKLTMCKSR